MCSMHDLKRTLGSSCARNVAIDGCFHLIIFKFRRKILEARHTPPSISNANNGNILYVLYNVHIGPRQICHRYELLLLFKHYDRMPWHEFNCAIRLFFCCEWENWIGTFGWGKAQHWNLRLKNGIHYLIYRKLKCVQTTARAKVDFRFLFGFLQRVSSLRWSHLSSLVSVLPTSHCFFLHSINKHFKR